MMKKFLRTFLSVLLVLTLVVSVTACGKKPPEDPDDDDTIVAELTTTVELALDRFESKKIEAKDKNEIVVAATWSSADSSIATVAADGTVSAKKVGSTTVTATYNGNTATCTVTVRDSEARPTLSLFFHEVTMIEGGQASVTPAVTYKGAPFDAQISVTGGNDQVATYTVENGVITFTGVAAGTMKIEVCASANDYVLTPIEVTIQVI